ncbi:MAG TPA: glutamine--fructose-6-phosphate transaminase (isomerizing) [Gammaproteobacteria bacterium]|jgi:glucosamine--fructose-6-phosphate aminotransferase (isomerizing)|nr:glutamine--fructose-6-phosphate transaminase (isomerizing) [Gammaproteobacteria bacterium]
MCGIVGAIAERPVATLLIDGLKKLEYRGYDSAGIATINNCAFGRVRVSGKVDELHGAISANPAEVNGNVGVAHTRWATHGVPNEENAHPFISHDTFALVHNGIVENHADIRKKLEQVGYTFLSGTDTEAVVHLIHYHFSTTQDLLAAVTNAVKELKGAYALGILSKAHADRLIAVRQGCPLVIGKGKNENFIASDPLALLALTKEFIYLEDNDIADISLNDISIYDLDKKRIHREHYTLSISQDMVSRGQYRHYMKKEIMEQPAAVQACLEDRITSDHTLPGIFGPEAEAAFAKAAHIQLVACGTSYHAALIAAYWIESIAGIPCSVEIASEFRYRDIAPQQNSLFVTLSQSGETADTLAALRLAKKMSFINTLVICNVFGSTMLREAGLRFLTRAGIEIGVASTKAFTTQLAALFLLALRLGEHHAKNSDLEGVLVKALHELPALIQAVLAQDDAIAQLAKSFTHKEHAIFLGRGMLYPIALEGALKMKEISYIHAEGYPAGELKHGPLALVDKNMPVIAMVPTNALLEKNLSNLQEIRARGGKLVIFTDQVALTEQAAFAEAQVIQMPTTHALLNPILYAIAMQLLAYHVAVLKGTDVDQPRNLAKSVTVE